MNQEQNGRGFLRVSVRGAQGAFPIPDASVRIYESGGEEGGRRLLYALSTSDAGLTPLVGLPAPPKAESEEPGNAQPYARYDVETEREGYPKVVHIGVPIFDGVVSRQPVLLVPLSPGNTEQEITERYPADDPLV